MLFCDLEGKHDCHALPALLFACTTAKSDCDRSKLLAGCRHRVTTDGHCYCISLVFATFRLRDLLRPELYAEDTAYIVHASRTDLILAYAAFVQRFEALRGRKHQSALILSGIRGCQDFDVLELGRTALEQSGAPALVREGHTARVANVSLLATFPPPRTPPTTEPPLLHLCLWQRVKASTEEILYKIDSYTAKLNLHDTERARAVVEHYEKVRGQRIDIPSPGLMDQTFTDISPTLSSSQNIDIDHLLTCLGER